MNYVEKIKKIGEYFKSSNVIDDSICVVVNFPSKWLLPDEKILKEKYKVEVVLVDNLFYFVTEIENGEDCIFYAIEEIIQSNRELETKLELLDKKVSELRDIFATEPLEKLQTLSFTFDKKAKPIKKKTKIETDNNNDDITNNVAEIINNRRSKKNNENVNSNEQTVITKINSQQQVEPKITEQEEPSSLVNFAMAIVNN